MLLSACTFAPAYDPTVNQTLAQIKANAIDLKQQCIALLPVTLTPEMVHDRLYLPALTLQEMSRYRRNASSIETASKDILKEITLFEIVSKRNPPSPVYCQDKLNDITLTVDAILKPYGILQ